MTYGLPVLRFEQVTVGHIAANFTLPGFKARISKGVMKIDLLKLGSGESIMDSNVAVQLEYLKSRIDIAGEHLWAQITFSVGPAFDFSMTPNLPIGPGVAMSVPGNVIKAPFAFGGAWVREALKESYRNVEMLTIK